MNSARRNIKVKPIVAPPPKKEAEPPKKTNALGFSQSKPAQSKTAEPVKNSSGSSKDAKLKEEKSSPKKQSPKKNQPPSKAQNAKSIASFFGSKPSTSSKTKADKSVAEAASKIESVKIKDEPIEATPSDSKGTQKRPLSNTSGELLNKNGISWLEIAIRWRILGSKIKIVFRTDSNEDTKSIEKKQTKKKIKLEPKASRSRLMQICDSSDEEDTSNGKDSDVPMESEEEVVVKKEKENKTPSPDKSQSNNTNGSSSGKRRIKVKRTVTKTYEDEDGFISKFISKVKICLEFI